MIRKSKDGYKVLSEKGKNLGGPYKTKKRSREAASSGRIFQTSQIERKPELGTTNSGSHPFLVNVLGSAFRVPSICGFGWDSLRTQCKCAPMATPSIALPQWAHRRRRKFRIVPS